MGLRVTNPDQMLPRSLLGCVLVICAHLCGAGERRLPERLCPFIRKQRPPGGSFGNPVPRTAAYVRTLTRAANAQECERVRSEGRGGRGAGRVDC